MRRKLVPKLRVFWMFERISVEKRKEKYLEHMKLMELCLDHNIVFPYLENLVKVKIHLELLAKTDIPFYYINLPPRFAGFKGRAARVDLNSEYFRQEILELIGWSLPTLDKMIKKFEAKKQSILDDMVLVADRQDKNLTWGTVNSLDERTLLEFSKFKYNGMNVIVFKKGKHDEEENKINFTLVFTPNLGAQLNLFLKEKLIAEWTKEPFI